jgi:hypothetical protein
MSLVWVVILQLYITLEQMLCKDVRTSFSDSSFRLIIMGPTSHVHRDLIRTGPERMNLYA